MKIGLMRPSSSLGKKTKPLNQTAKIGKPDVMGMPLNLLPKLLRSFPHGLNGAIFGTNLQVKNQALPMRIKTGLSHGCEIFRQTTFLNLFDNF